jgi:hypothetical protein
MRELLATGVDFDAVFGLNDTLALGAMRVLQESGRRIPGDVAVIGFDDLDEAQYSLPTLSTIDPGRTEIAETAVAVLAERIAIRAADWLPGDPGAVPRGGAGNPPQPDLPPTATRITALPLTAPTALGMLLSTSFTYNDVNRSRPLVPPPTQAVDPGGNGPNQGRFDGRWDPAATRADPPPRSILASRFRRRHGG